MNVGNTIIGGSTNNSLSTSIIAEKLTTGVQGGTLSSISMYVRSVDASYPNVKVALYSHDAGNNRPGNIIASTTVGQALTTGWNTIPIGASVSASTTYWVALKVEGASGFAYNYCASCAPESAFYASRPFGDAWPSPAGAPTSPSNSEDYSWYMTVSYGTVTDTFDGTDLLTLSDSGALSLQNSSDSGGAFRVQNSAGTAVFTVDTANLKVLATNLDVTQNLTVGGNVAFQRNTTDITGTGTLTDLNIGSGALFRFNGSSAQTLSSIANPSDGRIVTIINAAATALTIQNNTGGTAANRIITGTGSDVSVPTGATISFVYDSSASRWRLNGSVATSGGTSAYIQNQNSVDQSSANFRISGTGRAATALQAPLFDTATAVALGIGTTNATNITIGHNGGTFAVDGTNFDVSTAGVVTLAGGQTADITTQANTNLTVVANGTGTIVLNDTVTAAGTMTFSGVATDITTGTNEDFTIDANGTGATRLNDSTTIGASAGSGTTFTNNGSTVASTLALTNFASGGSIGAATANVDIYTSISVAQTTAGQTLTLPNPTSNTVYGRIVYLSNIGTASFTVLGSTLNPGATATLMWANANGGAKWVFAGADASAIAYQNAASQTTANFWISGTGRADTALQAPIFDTATATALSIGATNATNITLGHNAGTLLVDATNFDLSTAGAVTLQGGQTADITTQANANLTLVANGTGTINLSDTVTVAGTMTFSAVSTDITTGTNEDLTVIANGTGVINLNDSITAGGDITFANGATRTISIATAASGAGNALTVRAGTAASGVGGTLTLQGGGAAGTNQNGGDVTIIGGTATGTGYQGLINLSSTVFSTAPIQTIATTGIQSITAGNQNIYSTLPITASVSGVIAVLGDPGQNVIGRVLYVAARSGSNDFTLRLNSSRTPIDITLKANSTATLIWNGTDWTAAGASSSTDLQAAYNNTIASAGGAELVLNAPGGNADGFTIRNNPTTKINGGILEVQSSIGTNLFSVNDYATEKASNGGAETAGGTSTTFPASTWAAAPAGGTVTREPSATSYISTGQASVKVVTTATANYGAKDTLSSALSSGVVYQVSFTAKVQSGADFVPTVYYSGNGTADNAQCTATGMPSITTTAWSKVTCTFTASGTINSSNAIIIRQPTAVAHTFYIDNLSVTEVSATSTPANVQIGGGITGGQPTLFTLDQFSAAPVAAGNSTYYGSMYYDTTTGSIQCYESDGWGACGSPPDNIIVLTPEYAGAVLNGSGVGTMTADFCAYETTGISFQVGSLCALHETRNFYRWTSPQASSQTYSIYVNYRLPATFKQFNDDNTIKLTGLTDNTTNGSLTYEIYRKDVSGNVITQCGSTTTVTTANNTRQTVSANGNELSSCSWAGGDNVIFKINVTARSNANVYVENLGFTYQNR